MLLHYHQGKKKKGAKKEKEEPKENEKMDEDKTEQEKEEKENAEDIHLVSKTLWSNIDEPKGKFPFSGICRAIDFLRSLSFDMCSLICV